MTSTEARVRAALHDMAAESQPVPLLTPLMRRRAVERRRRIIAASAAAAATAATAAAVVGGLLLAGYHPPKASQPAEPTVKEFHLSDRSSKHPGSAQMLVTVSRGPQRAFAAFVLPTKPGGDTVRFGPKSGVLGSVDQQQLSADGRFLLQRKGVFQRGVEPAVVLTDLSTGQAHRFADPQYSWAGLSPDSTKLALRDKTHVTLIDVATGVRGVLPRLRLGAASGAQVGWSPDGRMLAVEDVRDTLIVDMGGRIHARLTGQTLVNGSMSWSPDGKSVLVYDGRSGLRVIPADGGRGHELRPPAGALRALGWTGRQVVWLVGRPGDQRLVTTDVQGRGAATWMTLDVGDRAVGSVSWSLAMGR